MITQATGIGIIASFIFTELVGLSPGGLIVPGYLAYFWILPFRLVSTFAVALISYGIVNLMGRFMVIYGRRRFMAAVLIGFVAGWALELFLTRIPPTGQDLRVIGYIVPGLIANDMMKQGVIKTILATLAVTAVVRLALVLLMA